MDAFDVIATKLESREYAPKPVPAEVKKKVLDLASRWMQRLFLQDLKKKARQSPDFRVPELDFAALGDEILDRITAKGFLLKESAK